MAFSAPQGATEARMFGPLPFGRDGHLPGKTVVQLQWPCPAVGPVWACACRVEETSLSLQQGPLQRDSTCLATCTKALSKEGFRTEAVAPLKVKGPGAPRH